MMTVNKQQVDYALIPFGDGETALVTKDGFYIPAYNLDGDTVVTLMLDGTACIQAFDDSYYFNVFDMSVDILNELEIDSLVLEELKVVRDQITLGEK